MEDTYNAGPTYSGFMESQPTSATLYMPIASPPTPAPSPGPPSIAMSLSPFPQTPTLRRQYISALLSTCTPTELLYISTTIAPLLKRDFLYCLPPELALHILSWVDDPRTLGRASQVSRHWRKLMEDECVWRRMCRLWEFGTPVQRVIQDDEEEEDETWRQGRRKHRHKSPSSSFALPFSYKAHFKYSYSTMMNWRHGGHLLRAHRVPVANPTNGVITSIALDDDWVVVGLANSRIHVFSTRTGVLARTLVGHESGVWGVCLVSCGGRRRKKEESLMMDEDGEEWNIPHSLRVALGLEGQGEEQDEEEDDTENPHFGVCGASEGWGQPNSLVVSGGCDKMIRVWDAKSGYCIYVLHGHTSTIRCIKMLQNRPIAVSGSRDSTLRVWDVQRGKMLRVLGGHHDSVRCLDVHGNRAVSGSYDHTCRVWDVDTGQCIHVLRGHYHQIYSVAFDGVRIASGGLDTTVRVWDAETGVCIAMLQGHTALVCQLQLSPTILATGGSDGRVITFSLSSYNVLHRIAAHDSSVTSLQFDGRWLVTGGNDGRVKLFETDTGIHVRDLTEASESVWKVAYGRDRETLAVMCRRAGKTVMEIWSMKPGEDVY
ncbi:WD40 repeat-like protein [Armillaria nabsnona]|nr:WD40 repeat-like protein [Armillaria nabsnona]